MSAYLRDSLRIGFLIKQGTTCHHCGSKIKEAITIRAMRGLQIIERGFLYCYSCASERAIYLHQQYGSLKRQQRSTT